VEGYGARPKEARTTGYYKYTVVPTDVVHSDQAMVSGRASVGQVRQLLPDIVSPVGNSSGLFYMAGAPALTWPESPAATSTLPVGWSVWTGVEPAKLYTGVVSDRPTQTPASPGYHNQHTPDSRSSCDQPLTQLISG